MINVLVVEDSSTIRSSLVNLLENDPEINVVGQAENGLQAVEMAIRLKPDLITMDVVMPDMNGIEATQKVMRSNPTPILIVTAHMDSPEMDVVFQAMEAGALDVVAKPRGFFEKEAQDWEKELLEKVKNLAAIKVRASG